MKPTVDADPPSGHKGVVAPVVRDQAHSFYRGVITCRHCNKVVPDTKYCIYCGKVVE